MREIGSWGRVLDSVESETAWRRTARPGESAIPGFLPARLKGRDPEGEVAGSAPRRPACRGGGRGPSRTGVCWSPEQPRLSGGSA